MGTRHFQKFIMLNVFIYFISCKHESIGVFIPDRGDQMEAARAGIMSPAAHLRGEAFPHFTPGVPVREALPHITPGLTGHHVLTVTAFSRDQVPRFLHNNFSRDQVPCFSHNNSSGIRYHVSYITISPGIRYHVSYITILQESGTTFLT